LRLKRIVARVAAQGVVTRVVAERRGVMGLLKDVVTRVVAERGGVMGLLKDVVMDCSV
jgi:hypothetical protein